jgi:hypothetical protein
MTNAENDKSLSVILKEAFASEESSGLLPRHSLILIVIDR